MATLHKFEDSGQNRTVQRQGQNDKGDRESSQRESNRGRVSQGIRYSLKEKKITIDSTEHERYEILKDKQIENIPIVSKISSNINFREEIDTIIGKEKTF